jgi:ABC-2 type transport system permease protein
MTTAETKGPVISPLVPSYSRGRLGGLGNLLRKELGQWWGTRMWWIQMVIWIVILNGITTFIMLDTSMADDARVNEAVQTFLLVGATAVAIGVVLAVQGAIVGEKELGTAAWVISKPASRASFVLAKLISYAAGFLVAAVLVPAVIFVIEASVLLPLPISYGSFALGIGIVALSMFFYLALTIALGTRFSSRGPITGIGIALVLMGMFFKGMVPMPVVLVTPWLLGDAASTIAIGNALDPSWIIPLVVTPLLTVLLVFAAMRRFEKEEF